LPSRVPGWTASWPDCARRGISLDANWRSADGRNDALPGISAEIVATNPDVIVVVGSSEGAAVHQATRTIPIVMVSVSDPVAAGLVTSFEHPGGNATGMTNTPVDVFGKRLQVLKDAVPSLARVAVLRSTTNPGSVGTFHDAQVAGERMGLQVFAADVTRIPEDLAAGFDTAQNQRADAMLIVPETLFATVANRARIAELAIQHRLPVIGPGRTYADSGALASLGPVATETSFRAAGYIAKILHGAKPADLPVGTPQQIEHVLNLKTAQSLGLTLAPGLLAQATEVIR
jgi:putative ABC transport system substrate-binding protein